MTKLLKDMIAYDISQSVDNLALPFVEPAFNGNVAAALSLIHKLPDFQRGQVAVAMWKAKVEPAAFRAFLAGVWEHDHGRLIAAATTRRQLAAMFCHAAFPIPKEFPERVKIWRGTCNISLSKGKSGFSWTTNRDVACWFALRYDNLRPQVISADIAKSQISYITNNRHESEVVLMRPPALANHDENPENWQLGFEKHQKTIKKLNAQVCE